MIYWGKKLVEKDIQELANDIADLSNTLKNKNAYFTMTLADFNYKEQKVLTGIGKIFYYGMLCSKLGSGVNTRNIKAITLESNLTTNLEQRPAAISFITFKDAQELKISLFDVDSTRDNAFWNGCTVRIWVDLTVK